VVLVPLEGRINVGAIVGIVGIDVVLAARTSGMYVEKTGTGVAVIGSEVVRSDVADSASTCSYVVEGSGVIGSDVTGL